MAMPGSQAMGLYPEVRQFQLPCSYKRYLELVSFWRNDMSDKERKKLLNFSPSELELALRATAMPKMHPRFKDFLGKLVSAGGVEPFQTYIKQVFASLFSVPVKKYNPQKPVGTPMGAMQNSPFAHICITDMGLMARVPGEVAVAISTEFMNKSGLLPVPPAWLVEMSKKQDELYAGKPARPYVCQLEADIVSTRIVYFLECYQVLFYLFLKLDRLNWKKTNKSELLPFLVPNDEDQLKAAVFSKFYKWGKKDVKAAREKQQAMMAELKEKEKQHAAAVAASDPMAPADATVGQEEQQLLDALAEMKLDDSSDYVPSTALYKMLDEFPERTWTDADKGKEFKGTVFAKHADVLFGRKPPPTEAEVEARNQKFLQEMADPNSEFNKRLRAQQAHGHGGHGHNHGGHGHNHGGHGGHGGHGHNHGASSSHGHSHGGKPCHGHGPKSPPQHGHSHGGKPCHGHSPAQPAHHGHSHGGKPCHGHGPAVFTPPKQGVCGRMGCGTSKEKMSRCAKCGTPYCSRECQIIDWKKHGHRQRCAALQQLKNTAK